MLKLESIYNHSTETALGKVARVNLKVLRREQQSGTEVNGFNQLKESSLHRSIARHDISTPLALSPFALHPPEKSPSQRGPYINPKHLAQYRKENNTGWA